MYKYLFALALILTLIFKQISPLNAKEPVAPLFPNLGNFSHPISSENALAQSYFNQGMTLAYGFNHAEAARSFAESTQQDPNCAICYWGIALVLGPNINAPMDESVTDQAWNALQKAVELSDNASESEKDYILALSQRYLENPPADRRPLDLAYAEAMQKVAQKYPEDLDAVTLYAEALMDTTPWDYWQEDGTPKPEGTQIIHTLESVLAREPDHIGANHLYIHAVEKEKPELGIGAADRLGNLVPGSGHLRHMPSHIYIRVGQYHNANIANQQAIAADLDYATGCHVQGLYPLVYMPHNQHFLWFGAVMNGQSAIALQAAQETAKVNQDLIRDPALAGVLQHYSSIPLYTLVRFSKWDEILATSPPESDLSYPLGVWHYARGMALVNKQKIDEARAELTQLEEIAEIPALKELKIFGFNPSSSILGISNQVLSAEIASQEKDFPSAIAHLEQAIEIEDSLIYTEPADWYHPVRQILGKTLNQAGQFSAAEAAYREDLVIYPDNGWSLYGLAQSLTAQGKISQAQQVQTQFQNVWQYADVEAL
ncbi:hypothetical protein [Gloeocapsa sp. PCC 73106]|uniref:tetratricopeptide repeat protein n=1 Tax=Gloeocapsa sp. PCC 73106 TaxID=102232 RepID=UPI0002ABA33C|nr:hypothetical protein [Gloeocapsa sp. PCC 73106]ELR99394.1 hypothetical protein GLO73106DRAFT_00032450 [Gloeocapsa sp. PCC 73106]